MVTARLSPFPALTGLELGTYKVAEIGGSKPGYSFETTYSPAGEITLSAGGATSAVVSGTIGVTNTYSKVYTDPRVEPVEIQILKLREGTEDPVSGAEFTLYNQNGSVAGTSTTNRLGLAGFGGLTEGTYRLEETAAPAGYLLNAAARYTIVVGRDMTVTEEQLENGMWRQVYVYKITSFTDAAGNEVSITDSVNAKITVSNKKIVGELTISKAFGEKNAYTPEYVTVSVSGPNGYADTVTLSSVGGWSATLSGLELGEYTVTETSAAPAGYSLTTAYSPDGGKVNLTAGTDPVSKGGIAITNTYVKVYGEDEINAADVYFLKNWKDANGVFQPLAGAGFVLLPPEELKDKISPATATSDSTGAFSFDSLNVAGTWTVMEETAPETFAVNETEFYIEVSETVTEKLDGEGADAKWIKVYNYAITSITDSAGNSWANGGREADLPINVENKKAVGSLTVTKAFGTNNAHVPQSVTLIVSGPDNYNETVVLSAGNEWRTTLENLTFGEYTVTEDKAANGAAGYELYTAVSPADGTVKLSAENFAGVVTVTNTYADLDRNPGSFTIIKTDGDTGAALKGVVFGLYSGDEQIATATTDENGAAVFSGFTEKATYTVREEAPLANYEANDGVWTVTIDEEMNQEIVDGNLMDRYDYTATVVETGSGELSVKNYKKLGALTISKDVALWLDGEQVSSVSGRDDGAQTFIFNVTIGDEPAREIRIKAGESVTIEDIPYGTAYSVEEIPYKLYESEESENAVGTIQAANTLVEVTNHFYYHIDNVGFNAVKLDADTKQFIEGAGFTLYSDKALTKVVATAASDAQGKVNLPITEAGTFYLKETTTPAGYHPNSSVYTVKAEINYEVIEDESGRQVIHQQMVVTAPGLSAVESAQESIHYTYVIENTAIKNVAVSVQKIWSDGGNKSGRPQELAVDLYRDGEKYETVKLTAENSWYHAWSGLTDEHTWSVDEPNVPADYEKTVSNEGAAWTIVNAREVMDIEGVKVWDLSGCDAEIPESVTIRLLANGTEVASTTADEANDWAWSFTSMPETSGGEPIAYTISEDPVEDFVPSVTGDAGTGFVLTNTYDPKLGGLTISKAVKGDGADTAKAFTFTLTLTGMKGELSYTGAANGVFDASKPLTFTLAHGQSITVAGIIEGTQYKVEEAGYKDYTAAVTNGSGTITEGEAIKVSFVNTYDGGDEVTIPKTGDAGSHSAMAVLASLAILWLGVACYVIKRKLFA